MRRALPSPSPLPWCCWEHPRWRPPVGTRTGVGSRRAASYHPTTRRRSAECPQPEHHFKGQLRRHDVMCNAGEAAGAVHRPGQDAAVLRQRQRRR